MIKTTQQNNKRAAFTLVEVMIVVVILGILAATVLPQFISTNDDAKESVLVQDLQTLRSQIQLFKFQHNGNILQTDLQMQMIFVMRYCFQRQRWHNGCCWYESIRTLPHWQSASQPIHWWSGSPDCF